MGGRCGAFRREMTCCSGGGVYERSPLVLIRYDRRIKSVALNLNLNFVTVYRIDTRHISH